MNDFKISFMEKRDTQESAKVLSVAMLYNPLHVAVFRGKDENERIKIEEMFSKLLIDLPAIIFVAKERQNIIGVMRMKSCVGSKVPEVSKEPEEKNDISWRQSVWQTEWARHDPLDQHWHLGPIGVLPSHQGRGVGSELMRRFCKEVDACTAKAYLETDSDINVRFYEKFGFKIITESKILNVPNRYMLRGELF